MSTERDGDDIIIFCTVENGCAARAIAAYSGRKRTKELFLIGQTPCGVHCIIFSTRKVQKKYTKNSHFYYSSFDSINTRARSGAHAKTLFKHARGEKNKTSPKHLIRQMEKSEQFSWFVYRKKIVRSFFFFATHYRFNSSERRLIIVSGQNVGRRHVHRQPRVHNEPR